MQTNQHPSHECPLALSAPQAKRLLIAANNGLRRDARNRNGNLRQLLVHVAVLETLDHLDLCCSEAVSSSRPPPYTTSKPPAPELDDVPKLEEAGDSDDVDEEWSSDEDEEDDAEHALCRVPSHPPISAGTKRYTSENSRLKTLDPFEWAKLASELALEKIESEPVTVKVVEIEAAEA